MGLFLCGFCSNQMHGYMSTPQKKLAPRPEYVSQKQLTIEGFETPFSKNLDKTNRWVTMAHRLPWDELARLYHKNFRIKQTGRPPLSPRLVIGSIIIKHMCNLDDRETVSQISENMYPAMLRDTLCNTFSGTAVSVHRLLLILHCLWNSGNVLAMKWSPKWTSG